MEIKGVTKFIERCFSYNDRNDSNSKDNVLFFRGEHTEHKELLPSIYQPKYDINDEDTIFKEIVAAFPEGMLAQRTTVEKLILMQHMDFPTRILDTSKNPLVGLFFSCYRKEKIERETDGRVYVFSVPKKEIKFCDSDAVCIVSNICKRPAEFSIKNIAHLGRDEFNEEEEIQYLIHEAREDKPYFQNLALPEDINSVICLHPSMNNPRIIRQDGYFFLIGIDGEKKKHAKINENWIIDKIKIPREAKPQIMKELDSLNINETFLFPDYEHFAKIILDRYSRR
jgi:hypothetical protein